MRGIAFVSKEYLDKRPGDITKLLGTPEEFDKWILFGPEHKQEDLALAAGFFKSKSEAKRNGWGGPIKDGYEEGTFGKGRTRFWIMNVFPHWDEDDWWKDAAQSKSLDESTS